jgi:hypothetical protein
MPVTTPPAAAPCMSYIFVNGTSNIKHQTSNNYLFPLVLQLCHVCTTNVLIEYQTSNISLIPVPTPPPAVPCMCCVCMNFTSNIKLIHVPTPLAVPRYNMDVLIEHQTNICSHSCSSCAMYVLHSFFIALVDPIPSYAWDPPPIVGIRGSAYSITFEG